MLKAGTNVGISLLPLNKSCIRLEVVGENEYQSRVYRRRAAELEELAARTKLSTSRDHFLRMAEEWRHLAESSEAMSERWGGASN